MTEGLQRERCRKCSHVTDDCDSYRECGRCRDMDARAAAAERARRCPCCGSERALVGALSIALAARGIELSEVILDLLRRFAEAS